MLNQDVAHIRSTFNNTIVTITDPHGNAVSWASAGTMGLKVHEKAHHLLRKWLRKQAAKTAMENGMKAVEVMVKGPGRT